ncbi:MAG TPA: iron uptake system protein EfeO [Actinomycetales bacterium]|nr:iron uptake system protein EfeO [Actinomycetales bacterium]
MPSHRLAMTVGLLAAAPLVLTACGDSGQKAGPADATDVTIQITDDGCAPDPASAAAGPITFTVKNVDSGRVTEAEVMKDGKIIGEKENLTPGLSGTFTLRLDAGDYTVMCPNAKTDRSPFTVTGRAAAGAADAGLTDAVRAYQDYLSEQSASLTAATTTFATAVRTGDLEKARSLYARTRTYYERIEPVAETFGDLDPMIDARVNDVADTAEWTGFHRIEKALWQDGDLAGMGTYADKLLTDVTDLERRIGTLQLAPEQIANGAVGLMDEVAKSKITGEEDRYSHTDLWDFAANVAGAREIVDVLSPTLRERDTALLTRIDSQLADVMASLASYQTKDGYQDYSAVTDASRRTMTQQVNALAESLSRVAPIVAGA